MKIKHHKLFDNLHVQIDNLNKKVISMKEGEDKLTKLIQNNQIEADRLLHEKRLELQSTRDELMNTLNLNASLVSKIKLLSSKQVNNDNKSDKYESLLEEAATERQQLATELSHYKNQYNLLREEIDRCKQSEINLLTSSKKLEHQVNAAEKELVAIRNDRNSLQNELKKEQLARKQTHDLYLSIQKENNRLNTAIIALENINDKAEEAVQNNNTLSLNYAKLHRQYESVQQSLEMLNKEKKI